MIPALRRFLALVACVLAGAALVLLAQYFAGNFHVVEAGKLYRSGQLSAHEIAEVEKEYGIRTIINLRGENVGAPWYDAEVAESRKLGIDHVDFRMSARKELTKARAEQLLTIFREMPKPILIHCFGGSDRSGLAASLYLAAIAKAGELPAEIQLSPLYGHFGIPYLTKTFAMDKSWEALEPWLGFGSS